MKEKIKKFNFLSFLIVLNILLFLFLILRIPLFSNIDKEVEPYIKEFNYLFQKYCPKGYIKSQNYTKKIIIKNMPIYYGSDSIGVCDKNKLMNERYLIIFDKDYWDNSNHLEKLYLVFHELSHCELNIDHSNQENNYMYYTETNNLDYNLLIEQTKENIIEFCNKL